ncbi:ABC transporter ATP-binding protein [Acuticoccus sp. M5D2P5]|uniref:ABC transporter ATP-binding protein n=1 Tax=Acuticoccus kalidii TaxID=2910977 RepID=UPI001F29FE0C|nr:ABC transporter ATP-binding protein [Acuticoccus kalidii]MCF3934244.1 ABC transporter ATP-binding protein [Acuticoccus kalidii]
MLELLEVEKRSGGAVHLADISLRLLPGTLNVLLGPTLSGKTSLMRIMAGLDRPSSGRILADDMDVTGVPVQQRDVAMVYQQFINYPAMTVFENIASPMRIARKPKAEIEGTVERVADLLKLTPYLRRMPLQLSGGQQQRTALARALAKNARLVLLDEPLANLDYKLREELRAELPKIFAASGAIFVYATAEPEEALLLGGNTATLSQGRVTQFGPTVDVYRRPNTLITARIFADPPLNVMAVEKRGAAFAPVEGGGRQIPVPPAYEGLADGPYHIAIRPHHVTLATTDGAASLPATVIVTEITGSESFVHLKTLGENWVLLAHGIHDLPPGRPVEIHLPLRHIMVFDADGASVDVGAVRKAA